MALVRPIREFVSTAGPFPVVLAPSDILQDTNRHVAAQPELFEELRATVDDVPEVATARPGERRATRAPR